MYASYVRRLGPVALSGPPQALNFLLNGCQLNLFSCNFAFGTICVCFYCLQALYKKQKLSHAIRLKGSAFIIEKIILILFFKRGTQIHLQACLQHVLSINLDDLRCTSAPAPPCFPCTFKKTQQQRHRSPTAAPEQHHSSPTAATQQPHSKPTAAPQQSHSSTFLKLACLPACLPAPGLVTLK